MEEYRDLRFLGRSFKDLRDFPPSIADVARRELSRVVQGLEPSDWKPMKSVGPGVTEIRLRDVSGAYRVIYIAKFAEAVYVLHCFEKKTQKTARTDLDLATTRYRALIRGRVLVRRG